ncbi:hypothetical protein [Hymenobacter swuensis]|uniref:Secreted protein n=1 Tax=Hymenobacter swuensis DY53 TaxID=1227739 RepID=W8F165_9BACT|nr:hypothetical protein [Hymenobacter swuensis]AHJ98643.1 hypothetical protein Hsw_3048 [Hymenobacter swuensis DY53]
MKRLLPLLLAGAFAATLTACDYNKTPGKDQQASQDFSDAPKARATETDLDSISGEQVVKAPIGTGSAADQKTSADAALDAAPGSPASPTSSMPQSSPEAQSTTREE